MAITVKSWKFGSHYWLAVAWDHRGYCESTASPVMTQKEACQEAVELLKRWLNDIDA